MQISRLFQIVYLLLNQKTVTAKELAAHFEVSQRTIYRDLETLSQSGIPLYTNRGRGGGISLMEGFVLNKSLLTEEEQSEILAALGTVNAVSYSEIRQVLGKLNLLFQTEATQWIEVDFSGWDNRGQEKFTLLKSAILKRQVIAFEYYGRDGKRTSRRVEPLTLWFKDRNWYLRGICLDRKEGRTFRLSRIRNLALIDSFFQRDRVTEAGQEKKQNQRKIPLEEAEKPPVPQQSWVRLKLKIHGSQAYRVYDEFDESQVHQEADGSFLVTVDYEEDEWVYGFLLSFGEFVQILEPERVRQEIKARLLRNLSLY